MERETDAEKQSYEESNFVRLPSVGKKERRKMQKGSGGRDGGYGGEDWRSLGDGAERIVGLTKGKRGGAGAVLERSRKRERDSNGLSGDQRVGATMMGERFEKRRKMVGPRERRKKK